jgi:Holliday junction resolvasome RuvABC endonuclease subunit
MPRYLYAFDLAMENTGLVIFNLDTYEPVLITTIHTDPKQPHGVRLHHLRQEIVKLGKPYVPSEVVFERGFGRFHNETQAIFKAHGVVSELFHLYPQIYYAPKKIKLIVGGSGNATKKKLAEIISQKYPHLVFIDNDQTDAYSVGIVHMALVHGMPWDIPATPKKSRKRKLTKTSINE